MALRIPKFLKDLLDAPDPEPGKVLGWKDDGKLGNLPSGDWASLGIYVGTEPPQNLVTHEEWQATKQGYWGFIDINDLV